MKVFSSINESANKFTVEELRKDYEDCGWATGEEKKAYIQKYGVQSKKAKDIKDKILLILKDMRKTRKSFNDDDLRDFSRMTDSDTKMIENLKDEPKEFIEYVKDAYFKQLKKYKIEKYALLSSLAGYSFSMAEKRWIKLYQKAAKCLSEVAPTQEEIDKKTQFEMINNKITELMQDFKVIYMKRIEEHAKIKYDYYSTEKNLQKLINERQAAEDAIAQYKKDNGIRYISFRDYKGNLLEKAYDKANSKVSQFRAFTKMYPTEKSYLDQCAKDGENIFTRNIAAISERLLKDKLNVNNIAISNVKNDPKFFEMMLTDGEKKLYLRSIFAAQFSDKMIPHFRFIITERK